MAVIVAAIINFIALSRMSTSLSVLSEPDQKISCVRVLLGYLSNEETAARYYSLTGDSQYLRMYHRFTDSVHYQLAQLRILILDNKKQLELADSISHLSAQREVVLNAFIENREMAIKQSMLKANGQKREKQMTKVEIEQLPPLSLDEIPGYSIDTLQKVSAKKEENEGKEFFVVKWAKGIFGSKEKKAEKNQGTTTKNTETMASDSEARVIAKDSIIPPVLTQQQQVRIQEDELESLQEMKKLSADELLLLHQDQAMMDHIRYHVSLLEKDETTIKEGHAAEANLKAKSATEMIGIISVLGLIGTLIFIILILRDISNSNRLRTQLDNERKRAEKLAKVKEEFLANMSHEIRTPLNSIIGYSELLAKNINRDTKEDFISAIQKSSSHLLTLVNQILDYSKLEAGKMEPGHVVFNFRELVREVYETFKLQASEKLLDFSVQVDEKIPNALDGDAMSMKQILINLVSNALKFTESGSVSIHSILERERSNSCRVKIEIIDTGIGIPEEAREKVFSAFTQSNSEITRKFGGTGLGLAITRKLTETLGGTIELNSEEGKGSVFTVSVPFAKARVTSKAPDKTVPVKEAKRSFDGKSILIVDDEEMNVKLCKVILENWGCKTDAAYLGKEALEKLESGNYDLVLLDIQMPEMSGIEVARAIRSLENEEKRNIPVVALTANVFRNDNDEFAGAGFSGELIKPFREQQLYEELEKHLLKLNKEKASSSNGMEVAFKSVKPYSLKYLEKTSGADMQFIEGMLQTFVQNNTQHLQLFRDALAKEDYEGIHNLAHKMIPSFRYLEMKKMESKLRQLELLTKDTEPSDLIKPLVEEIIIETEALLPMLNDEIVKLQKEYLLSSSHVS